MFLIFRRATLRLLFYQFCANCGKNMTTGLLSPRGTGVVTTETSIRPSAGIINFHLSSVRIHRVEMSVFDRVEQSEMSESCTIKSEKWCVIQYEEGTTNWMKKSFFIFLKYSETRCHSDDRKGRIWAISFC